jgi:hypothetical protein
MALRLLAGPYPMRDIDGNYARFLQPPMWFDALMAMASVTIIHKSTGDSIQPGALVQLDGATQVRNPALSAYDRLCHDVEGTGIARVNSYFLGYANREVHPVTLYPEGEAIASPLPMVNGAYFLHDRVLFGTLYSRLHADTGAGTLEAALPAQAYGGYGATFSPGPENGQVFIGAQDGAVLYDHINRQVVGWQRKLGFTAAFPILYSPTLGVWLVIQAATSPEVHNTISVYSDEPVPTALSNPVALATVGQGGAVEYRTRLLGSNGEPCAGVLVDWSSTSPGAVQILQSTTDTNGYAITRVALPIGSAGATFNLTAGVLL